jgi:thiol-disulfide isomerase/thioredoxin
MIEAPADGAVDAVVRRERAAAAAGTSLVVYVGATWCEPCERFKRALAAGELDDALAGVVFLGFDSDRDDARLEAAGYGSSVIPLFVVPEVSGRGGERRFAGSIKGPGAVRDIAGKLRALLTGV